MTRYQTLDKRFLALIIDVFVFAPVIALSFWINSTEVPNWLYYLFLVGSSALGLGYIVLLHWKYGQTIGKMVGKVTVVDATTEGPINLFQAFLRDIAHFVSSLVQILVVFILVSSGHPRLSETVVNADSYTLIPFFIWAAIDTLICLKSKKHRALHDFIAGTVVVRLDVPASETHLNPPLPSEYAELRMLAGERDK